MTTIIQAEPCPKCGGIVRLEKQNLSPARWFECARCGFHIIASAECWDEVSRLVARAREEGAKAMQTKAVEVAAWSHMVPPDGGSPSEDECAVARAAADAIAALDPAQITGANHDR